MELLAISVFYAGLTGALAIAAGGVYVLGVGVAAAITKIGLS